MFWLEQCAHRSDVGNKAKTLGILRAAGLPVLPGLVLEQAEVAAGPGAWQSQFVAWREPHLSGRLIARSSASIEDGEVHSAAGLFRSIAGINTPEELAQAVAKIAASAQEPAPLAYQRAAQRGEPIEMAVLVQPEIVTGTIGVALWQPNGELFFEQRPVGAPEWGKSTSGRVEAGAPSNLGNLIAKVVTLMSPGRALAVEYAVDANGAYWLLQARPVTVPGPRASICVSELIGRWSLDDLHNPLPLSPAQAGLVASCNRRLGRETYRVVDGYLYQRQSEAGPRPHVALGQVAAHFRDQVAPQLEQKFRRAAAQLSVDLAESEQIFVDSYADLGQLVSPAVAAMRQQLEQFLRANLGESLAQHGAVFGDLAAATLRRDQLLWQIGRSGESDRALALQNYLAEFGDYAPAWDVAESTDRENIARVMQQAGQVAAFALSPDQHHERAVRTAAEAAAQLFDRLDRMARRAWKALYPIAREVLALGEADDRFYFAAQALMRRALLERARQLVEQGVLPQAEEIFFVPLDEVLARKQPENWSALAQAAERRWHEQKKLFAPAHVLDGHAVPQPSGNQVLSGRPSFGQATGRILRWQEGVRVPAEGRTILLVAAILPSQTFLLAQVAGLITTRGGALSHGALLAREYGVPGVYGVSGAEALADGCNVLVDGENGCVVLLS